VIPLEMLAFARVWSVVRFGLLVVAVAVCAGAGFALGDLLVDWLLPVWGRK